MRNSSGRGSRPCASLVSAQPSTQCGPSAPSSSRPMSISDGLCTSWIHTTGMPCSRQVAIIFRTRGARSVRPGMYGISVRDSARSTSPPWMSTTMSTALPVTFMGVVPSGGVVRPRSGEGDAAVGGGLEDVDDGVEQDVDDAEQHGDARDGGEVGGRDGLVEVGADAGPVEDLLD